MTRCSLAHAGRRSWPYWRPSPSARSFAVSADETRYNLNGLCFEPLRRADRAFQWKPNLSIPAINEGRDNKLGFSLQPFPRRLPLPSRTPYVTRMRLDIKA